MKKLLKPWLSAVAIIVIVFMLQGCNVPTPEQTGDPIPELQTAVAMEFYLGLTQTAIAEVVEAPVVEEPNEAEATVEQASEEPTPELPTATMEIPTATAIVHAMNAGEPGWVHRWFYDSDSSSMAQQKKAPGGDDYYKNLFERPFTENDMLYHPDIDIQKSEISSDPNFFYFSIYLEGANLESTSLPGVYGAEIDTDLDGHGDYLFLCSEPDQAGWAVEKASAYKDSNNDVGGYAPSSAEAASSGNGYDQVIFSLENLSDPDALWCRQRKGSDIIVDIAVKRSLANSPGRFLWGTWAFGSMPDPAKFEFNDHFTEAEAGSPYPASSKYPLKALNLTDSTCRETFQFDPTTDIPGMCLRPQPTATTPPIVNTATLPPDTRPGRISGEIYWDTNNNGVRNPGENDWDVSRTFTLWNGPCGVGSTPFGSMTGRYYYFAAPPGTYCLGINSTEYISTPMPIQIEFSPGEEIIQDIGYYYYLG